MKIRIETGLYYVCPKCKKATPHVLEIDFEGIDIGEILGKINWFDLLSYFLKKRKGD